MNRSIGCGGGRSNDSLMGRSICRIDQKLMERRRLTLRTLHTQTPSYPRHGRSAPLPNFYAEVRKQANDAVQAAMKQVCV
jgi:hypothetical protein